jgi:hypothetical protein
VIKIVHYAHLLLIVLSAKMVILCKLMVSAILLVLCAAMVIPMEILVKLVLLDATVVSGKARVQLAIRS